MQGFMLQHRNGDIIATSRPLTHNNPVSIHEALERVVPEESEIYNLDDRGIPQDSFTLCSDEEHGYFLTDINGNQYFTLEDLRKAGIQEIYIKNEIYINVKDEESIRNGHLD